LSIALAGAVLLSALPIRANAQTATAAESGVVSIPLIPRAQMPPDDLRLVSGNEAAIARSAAVYGYELDSTYGCQEIACPLAPNHLLLAYESVRPNGVASRFTAVVPRNSAGTAPVPIISISHFGAIPFLPAGSNPHTLEVFNRVVSAAPVAKAVADNPGSNPLLFNSLCYLAMIGEPPAALTAPSLTPATVHAPVPTMKFGGKGSVTQLVSVRSSTETYQVWNFAFGRDGRLRSAEETDYPIDATPPILNAGASSSMGSPVAPAEVAAPAVAPTTTATEPTAPASPLAAPTASAVIPHPEPPAPAVPASPRTPLPANVVPRPPASRITDLPLPPSRFIPDASLPYPPQAPQK
jgi:hypothetical protein